MIEPCCGAGLLLKPAAKVLLAHKLGMHHFDCNIPHKPRVIRSVDRAHTAFTDQLDDPVSRKSQPDQVLHSCAILFTAGRTLPSSKTAGAPKRRRPGQPFQPMWLL